MSRPFSLAISDDAYRSYLAAGQWSATADDDILGEHIDMDAVRRLVQAFHAAPDDPAASQGLGLLALMTGVAEWGVSGDGLPADPAKKKWVSDTGEDSGKHLMSYAVGGVGISHADVGDLAELITRLAESDIVPAEHRPALARLTTIRYGKRGVVYDEVRAAGRCSGHVADVDLLGEPFRHFSGPAGSRYCHDYENGALTAEDWLVFRTWMRAALRTEEVQRQLLAIWFRDYWSATVDQVGPGQGRAEEMLINVRIRNSAPRVARDAALRARKKADAAERVQTELDAYSAWKSKTAKRRWKIMMRPVALYRHVLGLPPLETVGLD